MTGVLRRVLIACDAWVRNGDGAIPGQGHLELAQCHCRHCRDHRVRLRAGTDVPALSLILEARGYSDDVIGLNAAMSPAGILLSSTIIPPLARRFGARNVALWAAFASALLILGYKVFPSLGAWFVLRLVHGVMISTLFVLSEVWIVRYAAGRHRGKIVAIYASVLAASFAAGPALIAWIGIEGWLPFLIGAAFSSPPWCR
jgi:MFS family permease